MITGVFIIPDILMRPIIINLFLLVIFFSFTLKSNAQTCSGSLGDPVIYQTFGAGPNPGPALSNGATTFNYTSINCPEDGYYTILNSTSGCHTDWHNVLHDHTGDPNGYMMLINASVAPSVFFTQTANGLCPNTTYEFSAYILNLGNLLSSGPNYSKPNITFSVETMDGKVLATHNTGTILPTADPEWNKYGTYFVTPAGVTDVIVKMINNAPGGNGNDLLLDDIAFRACGPIVQTGFGDLATTGDQNVCEGSNVNYTLTASVGAGYNNPFLQWQINPNNTGWVNIAGKTSSTLDISLINTKSGSYQYRLSVGEGGNTAAPSCNVSSLPLTINVNPLPVISLPTSQAVCEGNILTLTATGGTSYIWSGPNLQSSSQNPLIINNVTPANAGTYTVIAISDKGCPAAPVQTKVNVVPKVKASIRADQLSLCAGESTHLTASGGIYYQWTPSTGLDHDNVANPVATPAQTTTYNVKVSNDGCFDDTKSITIIVNKNPLADAGSNKKIFEGQSVKLNGVIGGDNISNVYWTPATFLDDPTSPTPVASPTDDITYTLNVVSQTCGTATSSVFVRVYKKVVIPNTFSPNNDGINDLWNIKALITYPESSLMVYTRNGQKVYQSIGYNKPWDGTYNGSKVPDGTYYYVIDLKNNTPKISGWVLIVR